MSKNHQLESGKVADRQVLSKAYIEHVFETPKNKMAAWTNGPYAKALPGIKFYSNQCYAVGENVAVGIGSYGHYVAFNCATGVAIAKFSTYDTGQIFLQGTPDLTWVIQQARKL